MPEPKPFLYDLPETLAHFRDCHERQDRWVILAGEPALLMFRRLLTVFAELKVKAGNRWTGIAHFTTGMMGPPHAVHWLTLPKADLPAWLLLPILGQLLEKNGPLVADDPSAFSFAFSTADGAAEQQAAIRYLLDASINPCDVVPLGPGPLPSEN